MPPGPPSVSPPQLHEVHLRPGGDELLDRAGRHRRRAEQAGAPGGQVALRRVRVAQQELEHGGHAEEHGDPLGLQHVEDLARVEPGQHDVGGADHGAGHQHDAQLGRVIERCDVQEPVPDPHPAAGDEVDARPHHPVVVGQRALGLAGGAGGVEDQRVVGLGDRVGHLAVTGPGGQVGELGQGEHLPGGLRQAGGARRVHRPGHGRVVDEHGRARVLQQVAQLRRRGRRVDRHEDRAQPQRRVEGDDEGVGVGGHQREPVALGQPQARQGGRGPVDPGVQLAVGGALLAEDQRDRVRDAPRGRPQGARDSGHGVLPSGAPPI
jgi:hypothetical protein